eukprot:140770_1
MSVDNKQPPLKKRKLSDQIAEQKSKDTTNNNKNECIKCIWCNPKSIDTMNEINDNKNDKNDKNDCNCNKISSSIKSSEVHKIIEINNAGISKSKFKCYKLLPPILNNNKN